MENDIKKYIDKLASNSPTPGGGGVAGLCSSLASALCSMVCELTIGKKKYIEYESDMIKAAEEAKKLADKLFGLAEADETAFLPLSKAYSLPADTEEEKEAKAAELERCLVIAAEVPFDVARTSVDVLKLLDSVKEKCSRLAVSDVGVGATVARAGLESAALNVFINTKLMKNTAKAESLNCEINGFLAEGTVLSESIYQYVKGTLEK